MNSYLKDIKRLTHQLVQLLNFYLLSKINKNQIINTHLFEDKKFHCSNYTEYFRTYQYGKEETFLGAFLFLINEDDVVWDVGASIGLISIYASSKCKKVLSFEPDSDIFERLKKNIEINSVQEKVNIFNFGIDTESKTIKLFTDGVDAFSPSIKDLGRHSRSKMIEVRSIDSLINDGFEIPNVVKIDIEGAEILALKGGVALFTSNKAPRLLVLEVHPIFLESFNSSESEVIKLIIEYGYNIVASNKRDGQLHLIAHKNA